MQTQPLGYVSVILLLLSSGDGDAIQDYLLQLTKGRSVPRCFVGGKFIGGGTDVKALQYQGKLVPLLQKAGAL